MRRCALGFRATPAASVLAASMARTTRLGGATTFAESARLFASLSSTPHSVLGWARIAASCQHPSHQLMAMMAAPIGTGSVRRCATASADSEAAGPVAESLLDITVGNVTDPRSTRRLARVVSVDAAARSMVLALKYREQTFDVTVTLPEGIDCPVTVDQFATGTLIGITGFMDADGNGGVASIHVPAPTAVEREAVLVQPMTSKTWLAALRLGDGSIHGDMVVVGVPMAMPNEVEDPKTQLKPGVVVRGHAMLPFAEKEKKISLWNWTITEAVPGAVPELPASAAVSLKRATRPPRGGDGTAEAAAVPSGRQGESGEPREFPAQLLYIEKPQAGLDNQRFAYFQGELVCLRPCTLPEGSFVLAKLVKNLRRKKSSTAGSSFVPFDAVSFDAVAEADLPRRAGTVVAIKSNQLRVTLDGEDQEPSSDGSIPRVGISFTSQTNRSAPVGLEFAELRDVKLGQRVEGIVLCPTSRRELRTVKLLSQDTATSQHATVADLLASKTTPVPEWRTAVIASVGEDQIYVRYDAAHERGSGVIRRRHVHGARIGDVVYARFVAEGRTKQDLCIAVLRGVPASETGLRGTIVESSHIGGALCLTVELSDGRRAVWFPNPKLKHIQSARSSSLCDVSVVGGFGNDSDTLVVTFAKRGICRDVAGRVSKITAKSAVVRLHPTDEQTAVSGVTPGQTAYFMVREGTDMAEAPALGSWVTCHVDTTTPGTSDYVARQVRPMPAPAGADTENDATPSHRFSGGGDKSRHPDRRSAADAKAGESTFATRPSAKPAAPKPAAATDTDLPEGYLPVERKLSGTVVDCPHHGRAIRPDGFTEAIAIDRAHVPDATLALIAPGVRLTFDMVVSTENPDCVALNIVISGPATAAPKK